MGARTFDRFPVWARVSGFFVCGLLGGAVLAFLPGYGPFSAIFFIPALAMLMWQNVLTLRFDGRTWIYHKGLWPVLMQSRKGSFDDLNGLELETPLYQPTDQNGNTMEDAPALNTYTAYLRFKDDSIRRHPLISGRSFGEAAKPAALLAHQMRLPITLGRSSRGYDTQLSEYVERAQYPNVPGPGY